MAIFIVPPSILILRQRLNNRGTESQDNINIRINKAMSEMEFKDSFDEKILNDDLEEAIKKTKGIIQDFVNNN